MKRWGLLLIGVVLPYLITLNAPFVYDDKLEVVGNRTIRVLEQWDAVATYNFSRPLLIASYALNWWIGGLDPLIYHLSSLMIHLINTLLVGALSRRLLDPNRALLATGLWAAHPMLIEGVSYITGRSDALCALFWLVALCKWDDYCTAPQKGFPRLGAILAVAAAFLCKEVALSLPLALLALEHYRRGKITLAPHLWIWALGSVAITLRLLAYGLPRPEVDRAWYEQILIQAEVWWRYVQLWLLPVGQSILHDHPAEIRLLSGLALLAWGGMAGFAWRQGPWGRWCLALWALPLLPASLLPLKETMAEHRSYLAGLGLVFFLSAALPTAWLRRSYALIPLLLVATALRNTVWTTEVRLWSDAAHKNPQSSDAAYGEGDAFRMEQEWPAAEAAYLRVLALKPDHLNAKINLGIVLAEQGKTAEAQARWMEVLRQAPRSCAAHNNLGALARSQKNSEEAILQYQSSFSWCENDPIANLALGDLYYERGTFDKARFHYERYLRLEPQGSGAKHARQRLRLLDL